MAGQVKARGIRAKLLENGEHLCVLKRQLLTMKLDGLLRFPWDVSSKSLLDNFLPLKRGLRQRGAIHAQPINWTKTLIGRLYGISMMGKGICDPYGSLSEVANQYFEAEKRKRRQGWRVEHFQEQAGCLSIAEIRIWEEARNLYRGVTETAEALCEELPKSDHELAQELLAVFHCGREELIREAKRVKKASITKTAEAKWTEEVWDDKDSSAQEDEINLDAFKRLDPYRMDEGNQEVGFVVPEDEECEDFPVRMDEEEIEKGTDEAKEDDLPKSLVPDEFRPPEESRVVTEEVVECLHSQDGEAPVADDVTELGDCDRERCDGSSVRLVPDVEIEEEAECAAIREESMADETVRENDFREGVDDPVVSCEEAKLNSVIGDIWVEISVAADGEEENERCEEVVDEVGTVSEDAKGGEEEIADKGDSSPTSPSARSDASVDSEGHIYCLPWSGCGLAGDTNEVAGSGHTNGEESEECEREVPLEPVQVQQLLSYQSEENVKEWTPLMWETKFAAIINLYVNNLVPLASCLEPMVVWVTEKHFLPTYGYDEAMRRLVTPLESPRWESSFLPDVYHWTYFCTKIIPQLSQPDENTRWPDSFTDWVGLDGVPVRTTLVSLLLRARSYIRTNQQYGMRSKGRRSLGWVADFPLLDINPDPVDRRR